MTWRPTRALSIGGGVGVSRNVNDSQWIANLSDDGRTRPYSVASTRPRSACQRVSYTMTPTLSLQLYAQPFVSAGEYSAFKELIDGHATRYEDRYAPYAYGGSLNFNIRSFKTTNVLRWEYRPGSALFVVWQQGREGFAPRGDFAFSRDFDGAFSAPSTNLFLIKNQPMD